MKPAERAKMETIMKAQSKGIRAARKAVKAAVAAGVAAVKATTVSPMVVVDPVKKVTYTVDSGVCGFAWVAIPRQVGGKTLIKAMEENSLIPHNGKAYISHYGQSLTKAETFAWAFADSLRAAGYDVRPGSRID